MRSAVIILGGLLLLGLLVLAGWRVGGGSPGLVGAAKIFIAVWLVAALINMWLGVARAGYPVVEELPIFMVIFLIPAAVAALVWWKSS